MCGVWDSLVVSIGFDSLVVCEVWDSGSVWRVGRSDSVGQGPSGSV